MKTISFLGDIHGDTARLQDWSEQNDDCDLLVQVGDVGWGFTPIPELEENVLLLRGNHDSPQLARNHPNYIGDYGYIKEYDLFYLCGAWSIDWQYRIPGKSWWADEQLSEGMFQQALKLYKDKRPSLVVTHDCPKTCYGTLISHHTHFDSRTADWLDKLYNAHQPLRWVFGHHHQKKDFKIGATHFTCVNINESIIIKTP